MWQMLYSTVFEKSHFAYKESPVTDLSCTHTIVLTLYTTVSVPI